MGMVEVDEFLSASNIPIKGDGDGRYLLRADLLRACGESCTGDEGLAKFCGRKPSINKKNNPIGRVAEKQCLGNIA